MDIIRASEAFEKAFNTNKSIDIEQELEKIDDILSMIDTKIKEATEYGEFSIEFRVNYFAECTPACLFRLIQSLKFNGYSTSLIEMKEYPFCKLRISWM